MDVGHVAEGGEVVGLGGGRQGEGGVVLVKGLRPQRQVERLVLGGLLGFLLLRGGRLEFDRLLGVRLVNTEFHLKNYMIKSPKMIKI